MWQVRIGIPHRHTTSTQYTSVGCTGALQVCNEFHIFYRHTTQSAASTSDCCTGTISEHMMHCISNHRHSPSAQFAYTITKFTSYVTTGIVHLQMLRHTCAQSQQLTFCLQHLYGFAQDPRTDSNRNTNLKYQ